ncbi:MAG: coproporphyrinogen dehydrogenase HemZ [Clostridia bacterium]|nr:coproporphyrinogen dehydrogenase HemZ [Clostridia bacterium]
MKLNIIGDVSEYYAQTLCLLFFPGSKFSAAGEDTDGVEVTAEVTCEGGDIHSKVSIDIDGKNYSASYVLKAGTVLSRPSMASKIALGKAFLQAGKDAVGITPPWGILTGVRPSKLAMECLNKMSADDARSALVSDYSTSPDKASLACDVAKREKGILDKDYSGTCSLYIAIPFCPSRCSYCSFVSFSSEGLLSLIPEYLDALVADIRDRAGLIKSLGLSLSTVYIGGGTPTVLDVRSLSRLLDAVSGSVDTSALEEFTLEAGRPDTIDKDKIAEAIRHGVSRVSVNTQTLNDSVLSAIGRRHSADDFFKAYSVVRECGVKDINVDLIAGLPGDDFPSFKNSVDKIAELSPENVTVHTLCVKRSADLRRPDSYKPEHDIAVRSVNYSQQSLIERGYAPYYMYRQKNAVGNLENTGYALPGHEGIYNVLMMEEVQSIFAVGASAVTKLVSPRDKENKIVRIAENKYPYEYLRQRRSDGFAAEREAQNKTIIDYFEGNK